MHLTANQLDMLGDEAIRDHFLSLGTYSADGLSAAGIDPTTPHLFRFTVDGEMRYLRFQFTLDGCGVPNGIKLAVPLINAMNTQRHDVDRDQDEAHRTYLLRYWAIPIGLLNELSAYEALATGGYTTRQIQEAILSLWVN